MITRSLMPDPCKKGRAKAWLETIPEEEKCMECRGSGETAVSHSFVGGYKHWPCPWCYGSGRKEFQK